MGSTYDTKPSRGAMKKAGLVMSGLHFRLVSVAVVAIVPCCCVLAAPANVQARQYVMVQRAGDPGDGSEYAPSGGGYGAPSDSELGDPTDGNGWDGKQVDVLASNAVTCSSGDPGDGEEGPASTAADARLPDGWSVASWLVAALASVRR